MSMTIKLAIAATLAVSSLAAPAFARTHHHHRSGGYGSPLYNHNYGSLSDRQSFFYRQ